MKIFAVGNTMEVGETPGDQSMVRVKDRALRKTKPTAAAGVQWEGGYVSPVKAQTHC